MACFILLAFFYYSSQVYKFTASLFIYTEKASQYKPGDELDLVLKFPTEEEAMLLKAEVSRVAEDGIGVKFLNVTPYYAEIIERCYMAFKDPKDPER